jgi:hypothetical protein
VLIVLTTLIGVGCNGQHGAVGTNGGTASVQAADQQMKNAASKVAVPIADICALISQADVDNVLGLPGKPSEHAKDDRYASHCSYESVDSSNGVNSFGITIHRDENGADAKRGQAMKKEMYSNFALYSYEELSGIGDDAFLAVSKAPAGAAYESGPLASMLARQQILMLTKGSKDIEIIVSYFGKERSTNGTKALAKTLAEKL